MNRRRRVHALKRLHWPSVVAIILLMVTGVAFIYSAGYRGPDQPVSGFYRKQLGWCSIGLGVFVAAALADYRRWGASAAVWYTIGLVGLLAVLLFGVRVYGARRWLDFAGWRMQPSEFAKLAAVLAISRFLSRPQTDPRSWSTVLAALALSALPVLLIAVEPDLGSAMALPPVTMVLLWLAGVPLRRLVGLTLLAVLAAPLGWWMLGEYQRERLRVFWDPTRDPLGAGWNALQSSIAVGSGGLWGKGFLRGTQNVLGFLPRTVAPTDFIFSVIAEEKGFAGAMALIALYGVIIAGGLRAAARARDRFGQLWAAGLTTLLFFHVFTNIAMTVGLMPVTGLPLPFVSYGGSFMVAMAFAAGELQSVYLRRPQR